MEDLKTLFNFIYYLLNIEFELYGFKLSFWSIIVWIVLGSFAVWFVIKLFSLGGD